MGLFDFLKSKKEKPAPLIESEAEDVVSLDGAALAGLTPPESRYTQEYQDYLAAQEAAEAGDAPAEAE